MSSLSWFSNLKFLNLTSSWELFFNCCLYKICNKRFSKIQRQHIIVNTEHLPEKFIEIPVPVPIPFIIICEHFRNNMKQFHVCFTYDSEKGSSEYYKKRSKISFLIDFRIWNLFDSASQKISLYIQIQILKYKGPSLGFLGASFDKK